MRSTNSSWCVRKCPYCDFNSHEARDRCRNRPTWTPCWPIWRRRIPSARRASVFIGGGTPSLFSAEALDRLLSGLRARLPLRPDLEITLEANPGAVERGRFAEFRAAGVNRLSIGVQSFDDEHLRRLGRIHDRREALAAAEEAHASGLENFNLDLMFGLPGQTDARALADIATALALQPAHLSYYQLTLEPNTVFYRSPPTLPDDDAVALVQEQAQAELARYGYQQYEVSAYARPGQRCRHNLNYWEFGDYLGIGAGAHGKLSDPANGRIHRLWKLKQPRDYLAAAGTATGIGGDAPIREADLPVEFLMNALRLVEGVPATLFAERTGLPLAALEPGLGRARERVMEDLERGASERGLRFLNDLLQEFMPSDWVE
ncbi:MAG: radical SAM family heme chaperone HemW [Candidatus Competibacteraceae bacterium]|nr:radical SAM family heme chaperone HemW [Candidatus Competibacteraceae bacterium]